MCGFPKDTFYYYKAWWGNEPSLHLFPHWNFEGREGDEIPVWVYTNLDEVELFVNGKSQGKQKVPHLGHVEWKVRYEPGAIEARGFKGGKVVLTEKRETTGPAVAIRLTADRTEINADGEDLAILNGGGSGQGRAGGADGGQFDRVQCVGRREVDWRGQWRSELPGERQGAERSLFSGLAQVILQASKRPGEIRIEAVKEGFDGPELMPAKLAIKAKPVETRPVG